jgi:hypothetical protein
MNSKTARKYFADINLETLLSRKTNMHLSSCEIPRTGQEKVVILFAIPAIRQYFKATVVKMQEVKSLVHENFAVFRKYFNIFNQLKDVYR